MQAWGWVVPTPTKGEPGTAGPSQPVPPHGTSTDGARGGGGTARTSPGSVGCHRAPVPHLGWHQGARRGTLGSHMEELEGAQTMCRISCAPTRVPCCPLWGLCGVQQCKEPSSILAWSVLPRRVPIPAAPAGETGLISGCTPRYHGVDPPSGPFRGPHHRDRDDQGVGTTRPIPPLPLAPLGECFQPLSLAPVCFLWHFWVAFLHVAAGPHAQSRVAWRASVSLPATHLHRQRREASPGRAEPAGKLGHTVPESSKNYE